jgi:hypothetical protein
VCCQLLEIECRKWVCRVSTRLRQKISQNPHYFSPLSKHTQSHPYSLPIPLDNSLVFPPYSRPAPPPAENICHPIRIPSINHPIRNRPLGLVVKRITSTSQVINDKIASSILAEGNFGLGFQTYRALWRSGYRARLEILFLRERRFESCQRRFFFCCREVWGGR